MKWYQDNLFNELIVDNFAGGGGASVGIELAVGRRNRNAQSKSSVYRTLPRGCICNRSRQSHWRETCRYCMV